MTQKRPTALSLWTQPPIGPPVGVPGSPVVSSVSQSSGFTFGKDTVFIHGSGFTAALGVAFAGVPPLYFQIASDTLIVAYTAPATGAMSGDVTVDNIHGRGVLQGAWSYVYWTTSAFRGTAGAALKTFEVTPDSLQHSGGNATSWTDVSGAGRLAPVASAGHVPGYSANGGPNGGPTATFGGTHNFDCGSGNPGHKPLFSCLVVFKALTNGLANYAALFGNVLPSTGWQVGGDSSGNTDILATYDNHSLVPNRAYSHKRLDDAQWHWALATFDGVAKENGVGRMRLFVDGEAQAYSVAVVSSSLPASGSHFGIGGSVDQPSTGMHGSICHVVTWEDLPTLQDLNGIADLMSRQYGLSSSPVVHSSSPGVGALSGADLTSWVDGDGNLDVEVQWTSTVTTDSINQGAGDVWQGTSSDGEMSVRWDGSNWYLKVRGTDVVTATGAAASGQIPYYLHGDVVSVRAIYKPSSASLDAWLIFKVNGSVLVVGGANIASGSPLAAPSAVTLGSQIGGGSPIGASAASMITRNVFANCTQEAKCEGLVLGDSITQYITNLSSSHRWWYQGVEAQYRPGVRIMAMPGLRATEVLGNLYDGSTAPGDSSYAWVDMQIGTNEIFVHVDTESSVATGWNGSIAQLKNDLPGARLRWGATLPYLNTVPAYATWKAVLGDMGTPGFAPGSFPITGIDYVDPGPAQPPLNDGSDNLNPTYVAASPHMNDLGNSVLGRVRHDSVRTMSLPSRALI